MTPVLPPVSAACTAAAVAGKPVAHPEPGQSLISLIMITLSEDVRTEIGKPGG